MTPLCDAAANAGSAAVRAAAIVLIGLPSSLSAAPPATKTAPALIKGVDDFKSKVEKRVDTGFLSSSVPSSYTPRGMPGYECTYTTNGRPVRTYSTTPCSEYQTIPAPK